MKKQILPRFLGLLGVYIVVLLLLGGIQFAEKGSFSRQIGGIVVTGHYRTQNHPNRYDLAGGVTVGFGGMEFSLNDDPEGFGVVRADGTKEPILPESLTISTEAAVFEIPGGTKVIFTLNKMQREPELLISAVLGDEVVRVELPYKPQKDATVHELADGQFVLSAEGVQYRFNRTLTNAERYVLFLPKERGSIAYTVVPETQESSFSATDFIIPAAQDKQTYDRALGQWREQNFTAWGKNIGSANNEDLVTAFIGEAINQGRYATAVGSIPLVFLNGTRRTHESSVFLGRLDQALRSLTAAERDTAAQLAELITAESLDFLQEPNVFEYLIVRGLWDDLERGVALVRAMTPEALTADRIAGILEAYFDWQYYQQSLEHPRFPAAENPFEPFTTQVYLIIANRLSKNAAEDRVFVFFDGAADLELNLRLGRALSIYADAVGNVEWAGIGRSMILSVLSLTDEAGTVPAKIIRDPDRTAREDTDTPRITSARLYRVLHPGENYPHGVRLSPEAWAWTAATAVTVTEESDGLDIAVTFPVGETHYMLIRGIAPPTKLQLYGIDYRTAPDFERYNSSGWSYAASDQTLMLKLRHRSLTEHIRVFK